MRYSFDDGLLANPETRAQRSRVLPILSAALEAVDPYVAVSRALALERQILRVAERSIDLDRIDRVFVVGAGKAGAPMSRAIEDLLGPRITAGYVNVKYGHVEPTRLVELQQAAHPIPDQAGLTGTRRIVDLVQSAGPSDLVLCVLSGGGSALLQLPAEGISLTDTQQLTELMLRAGATINELNAVRKHLSQVTGGGLARLAQPALVVALLLSDVVGNPLDVIASGPTAPDSSTFADAISILKRFDLWGSDRDSPLPSAVRSHLQSGRDGRLPETPKPSEPVFERVQNTLVASNEIAAQAAQNAATVAGFRSLILSTYVEGEAREVGKVLAALAREVNAFGRPLERPCCLIVGGETTVTVRGTGQGGRNQEVALGAALKLAGLPDSLVVALATDGNDGPTDAAGAVADGTTLARAAALGLDAHAALAQNDSYDFFSRLGDLLKSGPTNTNVNDLSFVFLF